MKCSLPKEVMSYKQQIKDPKQQLIVKLQIAKLVLKHKYKRTEVARKYGCCRKTIYNILTDFKSKISLKNQMRLLNESLSFKQALVLLKPLTNKSRAPHSHSRCASQRQADYIEELIKEKGVSASPRGLQLRFEKRYNPNNPLNDDLSKFEISLSNLTQAQIRGVFKRRSLKPKNKKTASGDRQPLYSYQELAPFEYMHFDTKDLADKSAISQNLHNKIKNNEYFPEYEFNLIDAKSRFRFMSFSNHLYSEFGLKYLVFVIQFIRAKFNNWQTHTTIFVDNGVEFCRGSKRKEKHWNQILKPLNAHIESYHSGFDVRKNLIERSHRPDDSQFLRARGDLVEDQTSFLNEASYWWYTYNFTRPHTGIAMNERTPYQVLKDSGLPSVKHILEFPILLLDQDINLLRKTTDFLLLKAELDEKSYDGDRKQFLDASCKYEFFSKNGENVFTDYLSTWIFSLMIAKVRLLCPNSLTRL
jgi:hypothetical protein